MPNIPTTDELHTLLKSVENQIDSVLADSSSLMAAVARKRVEWDESVLATERPLGRMSQMQQSLIQARRKIAGVHADLAKLVTNAKDIATQCPCRDPMVAADPQAA